MTTPSYLTDALNGNNDPRAANLEWFRNARYGLFLHYGLYSLLKRHEWVQCRECIPVAEYAKLADDFKADRFDAAAIARFAKDAGMKYINLTTRHHDCFCLWPTEETDFHVMNSPCQRDLVGELATACEEEGLAFFLYYSHGRDWKHPHAPNNDKWRMARPNYDPPEPSYAYGDKHDLNIYLDFMTKQITELLTRYPTVAGIWLDGIATPASGDHTLFKCQALYDHIHSLSPHALVSYKQGLLGTEDFFAPEHKLPDVSDGVRPDNPVYEICTTMIEDPRSWGYYENARHRDETEVWQALTDAGAKKFNLLLNTGPLPDGSLDPQDTEVILKVGQRLQAEGVPA